MRLHLDGLTDAENAYLDGLRSGETSNGYARRLGYSESWGKQKSRRIKRKLGVETIGEAVAMSEAASEVTKADFDKLTGLVSRLGEAVEELAKRPSDQAQQQVVRERELDVKDHAKALGISLDDVQRLKEEKDYDRFKAMQARLDKEREEEAAAAGEGDDNGDTRGLGERILDGLGGVTNVKPK